MTRFLLEVATEMKMKQDYDSFCIAVDRINLLAAVSFAKSIYMHHINVSWVDFLSILT